MTRVPCVTASARPETVFRPGAFNHAGPTVEWRIAQIEGHAVPVAAIQRFHLADPGGGWATQILVVSKVGQPDGRSPVSPGTSQRTKEPWRTCAHVGSQTA
ncbi:hypothetical protein [Paracoccus sp. PAMC 22219]|uniref:hypothetical protein n=1 Tax=Paracoccus sp. PAMC 22219 TaxID=1569209 RepID=UPI0005AB0008|nr:hypothetical protein [Paracoccus sp. PAMC 22219]